MGVFCARYPTLPQLSLRRAANTRRMLPERCARVCFTFCILALTLVVELSFASEARTLTLAHVGSDDSAIGRGADRLARELAIVSDGALTIDIIPRAALGGIRDNWVQMQLGSLDMQAIDLSAISLLESAAPIQVSIVPFLFRDQSHFRSFARSKLLTQLLEPVQKQSGIRYLGIVEDRSPRVISTTERPIKHVSDMQGLKIRVPPHPMFIDVFKSWGAIPTPLPGSEMFMALQSGLVGGEDNGVVNLVAGSNATVIKYFTPINWSHSGVAAWISEKSLEKLSEDERHWLRVASANATLSSRLEYQQQYGDAMAKLAGLGIELLEPDIQSFRSKTHDLYTRYEGTLWPTGLVERIDALR